VFTAVLTKVRISCDMTLCCWVCSSQYLIRLLAPLGSDLQCCKLHTQQYSITFQKTWTLTLSTTVL